MFTVKKVMKIVPLALLVAIGSPLQVFADSINPVQTAYAPVALEAAFQKQMVYYASSQFASAADLTDDQKTAIQAGLAASRTIPGDMELLNVIGADNVTAFTRERDTLWIGTKSGLQRVNLKEKDPRNYTEYLAGPRYLYNGDDQVTGLYADGDNGVWVENSKGIVHIIMTAKTLKQKADTYEQMTQSVNERRGMVAEDIGYSLADGQYTGNPQSNDNDGLWTGEYALGEIYRYLAAKQTGDTAEMAAAKTDATHAAKAVMLLAQISGRGDGFLARSYILKGVESQPNGLWFEKQPGVDADGNKYALAVNTGDASTGKKDNFIVRDPAQIAEAKAAYVAATGRSYDTDWGGDFGEKDDDNNPVLDTDGAPIVDVYPVVLDKQNPSNAVWRLKSVIHEDVDPLLASLYTDMGYTDSDVIYKADTSSDEVTGQMSLLYFAAKYLFDGTGTEDGQLKALAIKLGDKLVKHIVTNGFRFVDAHGNATKWARWYASYFAESIDPTLNVNGNPPGEYTGGYEDATLNAAEIMSFVKVAAYLTSLDAAYSEDHALFQGVYEDMWGEWKGIYDDSENGKGYIHVMEEYIKRKKEVISSDFDDYQDINSIIHASGDWTLVVNYSDENLFAMSFLPLIDIEMQENPNSDRVAALRGVLEQWWTNMKRENNPFYTFLYQYANPQKTDVDLSSAAWMLERMPQYRINFPVNNSSRKDLFLIDYFNYRDKGSKSVNRALPFDESLNIKFNSNPFTAHTGTNDKVNPTAYNNVDYSSGSIQSGTWFTLPYWMGRYYGMLQGE